MATLRIQKKLKRRLTPARLQARAAKIWWRQITKKHAVDALYGNE